MYSNFSIFISVLLRNEMLYTIFFTATNSGHWIPVSQISLAKLFLLFLNNSFAINWLHFYHTTSKYSSNDQIIARYEATWQSLELLTHVKSIRWPVSSRARNELLPLSKSRGEEKKEKKKGGSRNKHENATELWNESSTKRVTLLFLFSPSPPYRESRVRINDNEARSDRYLAPCEYGTAVGIYHSFFYRVDIGIQGGRTETRVGLPRRKNFFTWRQLGNPFICSLRGGIERGFGAPRGCRRDQGRGSLVARGDLDSRARK